MKTINQFFALAVIALSVTFISCGSPSGEAQNSTHGQEQNATYTNVSVEELHQNLNKPNEVIILDVRTDGEVAEGMVAGAKQINVNGGSFEAQAAQLDKTKTVYVYCRSGMRSQKASDLLIGMGFTDVRNVEGGYLAWQKAGY